MFFQVLRFLQVSRLSGLLGLNPICLSLAELTAVPSALQARAMRQLDKQTDLSTAEKDLMLSWNLYLHDHPCRSDAHMSQRCLDFAAVQSDKMQADADFRRCFMVHLINLWDFNLVSPDLVDACMASINCTA